VFSRCGNLEVENGYRNPLGFFIGSIYKPESAKKNLLVEIA